MASEEESAGGYRSKKSRRIPVPPPLLGMGAAVATMYISYNYGSFISVPSTLNIATKLGFTCKWLLLPSANVFFAIMESGRARGRYNAHPLADKDHLFQTQKNVLMNTVEQYCAFTLPLLALGASVQTTKQLRFIPALCIIFFVGRILFRLGYPDHRSFGYSLNMFGNVFNFAANAYLAVKYGVLGGLEF